MTTSTRRYHNKTITFLAFMGDPSELCFQPEAEAVAHSAAFQVGGAFLKALAAVRRSHVDDIGGLALGWDRAVRVEREAWGVGQLTS